MKTRNKRILDEDLAKVGVALRRSAKRAREEAERSNTPLIIFENGRVIEKDRKQEIGYCFVAPTKQTEK